VTDPAYIEYQEDPYVAAVRFVNDLFAARGMAYRLDENGRAHWHGDEGAYIEVIRPALDALGDVRLAGARQEFEAALGQLRAGTPKDDEGAIEESGKAVESAMKVVLDERGYKRIGNESSEKLWQALRDERSWRRLRTTRSFRPPAFATPGAAMGRAARFA
jgi:hypothetical protein